MAQTKVVVPKRVYNFLQSPKTMAGFDKMRIRGAAPPPFQVIQIVTEVAKRIFLDTIATLEAETTMVAMQEGKSLAGVSDDGEALALSRHLIAALRERLKKAVSGKTLTQKEIEKLSQQFLAAQQQYFEELSEDADEETKARVLMALETSEVFRDRLEGLRDGYLNIAIEKIDEGQSELRKRFITMFSDWIEGKPSDMKTFSDVMTKIRGDAGTFSRFFARDQFSRFNRALTVTTYQEAGAKWVKWLTVDDARVRKTHRALQGKIFKIDDLPAEYLDYMCRCAMIPLYDLKGQKVTRGHGISLKAA